MSCVGPHPHALRLDSLRSLAGPQAPMPPAPMAETTSYGPSRVPVVSGMGSDRYRKANRATAATNARRSAGPARAA
jgi:hypothetical protein